MGEGFDKEHLRHFGISEYSLIMNTFSFTLHHRRSTKTLRLHYGLEGMKYIIQMYEGEINWHGEKEGLPTEFQYEFEQEMLKHVHDLKKDLRKKGWTQRGSPEVSQISFLRSENSDAVLGFKFEWWVSWELSSHCGYICTRTSNWEFGLDWFMNFISISVYAIC